MIGEKTRRCRKFNRAVDKLFINSSTAYAKLHNEQLAKHLDNWRKMNPDWNWTVINAPYRNPSLDKPTHDVSKWIKKSQELLDKMEQLGKLEPVTEGEYIVKHGYRKQSVMKIKVLELTETTIQYRNMDCGDPKHSNRILLTEFQKDYELIEATWYKNRFNRDAMGGRQKGTFGDAHLPKEALDGIAKQIQYRTSVDPITGQIKSFKIKDGVTETFSTKKPSPYGSVKLNNGQSEGLIMGSTSFTVPAGNFFEKLSRVYEQKNNPKQLGDESKIMTPDNFEKFVANMRTDDFYTHRENMVRQATGLSSFAIKKLEIEARIQARDKTKPLVKEKSQKFLENKKKYLLHQQSGLLKAINNAYFGKHGTHTKEELEVKLKSNKEQLEATERLIAQNSHPHNWSESSDKPVERSFMSKEERLAEFNRKYK